MNHCSTIIDSSHNSSSSCRIGQSMYSVGVNTTSSTPSYHYDDTDGVDERTTVLRTMKSLENSVYKRPNAQCLPEIFRGMWRKQIVEWMYILVKYCKLKHEATAAAVYYLDVAVWASSSSSSSLVKSPRDYQLCAMTSLHLALKVYDSPTVRVVKLSCLVKLGNGEFTEDDIIQKEQELLRALSWRINPPTANCFLQRYLELLQFSDDEGGTGDSGSERDMDNDDVSTKHGCQNKFDPIEQYRREQLETVEEVALDFIEVAMAHDRFLSVPSAVIAYAALLSAIELTMEANGQKQQQQNGCGSYDWVTFLHKMNHVAEMGDIMNGDDHRGNGKDLSLLVLRTKLVLERIVKGLPAPAEEEDDSSCDAAFAKTKMLYWTSGIGKNNKHGKINDDNNTYRRFTRPSKEISSSSPSLSPTSTI